MPVPVRPLLELISIEYRDRFVTGFLDDFFGSRNSVSEAVLLVSRFSMVCTQNVSNCWNYAISLNLNAYLNIY